ncbi:beta-N-acetylhexosaminidase [Planococcus lenghuensis]|uniref:beta-N-acetylhexosaminidase n=1 Tax=Planococcus lenghuensis TaxID=2213202 RepID=A0A1Q2KZR3_9BACL|nr:beta-N-acetylhexosaminidase [Planococcus lenghuensis]AQQ53132.1 beta-N-acetylhexosaminidase [Planococcus lenghuensis]
MNNLCKVFAVLTLISGFSVNPVFASPNSSETKDNNQVHEKSQYDTYRSKTVGLRAEMAIRLHRVFYPEASNLFPLIAAISSIKGSGKVEPGQNNVSDILSTMSLEEKIGQMMIAGISGTALNSSAVSLIDEYQVGGLILYSANLTDIPQSIALLNQLQAENSENRFPLFLSVDQEGGRVSRLPDQLLNFPVNQVIGNVNNAQYSYEIGELLGEELNSFGFNVNFAPVLDVNSNPDNPVIGDRSFSPDPHIVSDLGIQTMKGMQSQGIIPVIKHFPGHGDTSVDSHLELPVVNKTLDELKNLELIPFTEAIEHGADAVMVAHILLPELDAEYPATLSPEIIDGLLRDQLDFNGVVITDDMTMQAITDHYGIGPAAVQSVIAGSDILLVAHHYDAIVETHKALVKAVEEGVISEERIDESVQRILQLKKKYELSDSKAGSVDTEEINGKIRELNDNYLN